MNCRFTDRRKNFRAGAAPFYSAFARPKAAKPMLCWPRLGLAQLAAIGEINLNQSLPRTLLARLFLAQNVNERPARREPAEQRSGGFLRAPR